MAFSRRDDLYQRPNFAIMGTGVPDRLRRTLPPWTNNPSITPPPNPANPFDDTPRAPDDVDPPERNPYNDLDFAPFVVSQNASTQHSDVPAGGLLGLLQAMTRQANSQPNTGSVLPANGAAAYGTNSDSRTPSGLRRRLLTLQTGNASDIVGSNDLGETRAADPQKPIRYLSRRLA